MRHQDLERVCKRCGRTIVFNVRSGVWVAKPETCNHHPTEPVEGIDY